MMPGSPNNGVRLKCRRLPMPVSRCRDLLLNVAGIVIETDP